MAKEELQRTGVTAVSVPDFLKTGDTRGTEHITREEIQMPRIGLAQGLSPEIQPGNSKFIEGLTIGQMFNNLTGQIYGRGPIRFCVVRADPPRWVEFFPREIGGGVKDLNVPPNDPRTQFTRNSETGESEKPLATKFMDFVVMLLPTREVVALSFKSAMLATGRQLNGLIKILNVPVYGGHYELGTAQKTNPKGTFSIFTVKNIGFVPDAETASYAEGVFNALRGKEIVFEREPGDEDEATNFDPENMPKM